MASNKFERGDIMQKQNLSRFGDEEITQERWGSSKARDPLAYFVTFRR
jgi:hypothetical protein